MRPSASTFVRDDASSHMGLKCSAFSSLTRFTASLGDGYDNTTADGDFVKWFDELFREERDKNKQWADLLPGDPVEYRRAYFLGAQGSQGPA